MKRIFLMLSVTIMAAISLSNTAFAEGDAVKGKKVFKKCKACHTVDQGGKNLIGPNLFGIVGNKAAIHDGYKYSPAMKASGLTWDEATLDTFLKKPKAMVKKTKMTFAGLKKPKHRANVIAYLKTLQ
ncbi:Cytochrome c2 [hydrothermal vent metagenome]|uniref:Cytochrome c2 n=1 Tax=hydrothermal vent metagenome TaxID=652676 RepID=A0A3B0SG89_9ZZZZ